MEKPADRKIKIVGWLVVLVAIGLGAVIRLLDLEHNPPGLWQDEASTGLDAYLIWTTAKDRAGAVLPIISRSFGDYPLAGYRYLAAPIVGTLGLTIGHQRIVAAVTGTLMVAVTAWVARDRLGGRAAVGAAMSAALCPTWIHFSRYGSEAILLPFSLITGFAFFEFGRPKWRRWPLWVGALALASAAYTYHAVKLILPLWMLGFLIYHWPLIKELWRDQRIHLIGPAVLFAAAISPSIYAALTEGGMARGRTVLAWYHHSGYELFRVVLNNYLTYFDFGMLFVRGGPAVAQSIPGLGLWNLIELPFIAIGVFMVFRNTEHKRVLGFIFFWFLLGPLPGGITYETHNIGRVIAWLPAPQLLSGYGMYTVLAWASSRRAGGFSGSVPLQGALRPMRVVIVVAACAIWIATAANVTYLTLVKYPATTERDWQFEITRALLCAKEKRKNERIIVAPQFQAIDVFARFHLWDLDRKQWSFGNRTTVGKGELYVVPANKHRPKGKPVCEIRLKTGGDPRAFVYAAKPLVDKTKINLNKKLDPHGLRLAKQPRLGPALKVERTATSTKTKRKK